VIGEPGAAAGCRVVLVFRMVLVLLLAVSPRTGWSRWLDRT
jgi:hypothetical protein